jgi:hypothetical protein
MQRLAEAEQIPLAVLEPGGQLSDPALAPFFWMWNLFRPAAPA